MRTFEKGRDRPTNKQLAAIAISFPSLYSGAGSGHAHPP